MILSLLALSIEVGTAVAWLSLLVSSYLAFREYQKRPRLSLKLNVRKQGYTQLPNNEWAQISRWVRICVTNSDGRRIAKNCRAYLVGVQRINADGSVEHFVAEDCRYLPWMNDNYEYKPRDIFPGMSSWVDLYMAYPDHAYCFSLAHPVMTIEAFGDYRLAIQVSAEEANAPIMYLRLTWNGDWDAMKVVEATPGTWVNVS